MKGEFVLYKGDDLLSIGTIEEIAKDMGVATVTIRRYFFSSYQTRYERKGGRRRNTRILVKIDD